MDRAFSSGSSASPPAAPGSPSIGYPTSGNSGTGTPATKPGPYWYHMITEEIRGVLVAAGLTPSQGDVTQLLQALRAAGVFQTQATNDSSTKVATTAFANPGSSLSGSGYQKLPSGLIIQWGTGVATSAGAAFTFPLTFPTVCYSFSVSNNGVASGYNWLTTQLPSTTGATMQSSTASNYYSYIAIGK